MADSTEAPESYHVLLIGIDAYPKKPLYGCVNDIDAVQKLLLERAKVAKERILRLASPRENAAHAPPGALPRPGDEREELGLGRGPEPRRRAHA